MSKEMVGIHDLFDPSGQHIVRNVARVLVYNARDMADFLECRREFDSICLSISTGRFS